MKIIIHLRSDAELKSGGDVTLGKQYKAVLEEAGHQVDLTTSCDFSGQYDLGLTFNFDRPFEAAQFIENCKNKNVPSMIYALHHPTEGVARYLQFGTKGARRFFSLLSMGVPHWYETWLGVAKALAGKLTIQGIANLRLLYVPLAQQFIIRHADRILVSTEMESEALQREFLADTKKIAIVPHILHTVPSVVAEDGQNVRDVDVVCAGRIESRKNQLLVASLARALPNLRFVFIGTPSATEGQYFSQFQQEIEGLKNVDCYPNLPMDELRAQFRRSRIFISLSWFEVVSLTEMEALACGCHLVVGRYSYSQRIAGAHGDFVEPNDVVAIEALLRRLSAPATAAAEQFDTARLLEMSPDGVGRAFASAFNSAGLQ